MARQRLKALVADGRYDYMETGSLLSIKHNVKDILIPSEEDRMEMHPLDFEEYLWAMGDEVIGSFLRDCFDKKVPVGPVVHRRAMEVYRQYLLVGGMPQAVMAFLEQRDFEMADKEKKRILALYIYAENTRDFNREYESAYLIPIVGIPGTCEHNDAPPLAAPLRAPAPRPAPACGFAGLFAPHTLLIRLR